MKKISLIQLTLNLSLIILLTNCADINKNPDQRTRLFDDGWRFAKNDLPGAEDPAFDDSGWRTLDLPHDWSIEDLPGQKEDSVIGPFSRLAPGKMSTGYTIGGTGWYRKNFTIDGKDAGKIIYLQFDGVYMNSDVWINGKHAGNHPNGYTSFYYDITPFLNPAGQQNMVAVRVRNEGINSRWYSGSGIYRHVWLTATNKLHFNVWGVYITTPSVSDKSADVKVVSSIHNASDKEKKFTLKTAISDPKGVNCGSSDTLVIIPAGGNAEIATTVSIISPELWETWNPVLYKAEVTILDGKQVSDNLTNSFGIRSISFDAENGFRFNGKSIELKGGCFHHDNGPLGSAAIDRAEERKIELLQDAGFNAIRCSHNPPNPYLLDVCDRLGMLVIDEFTDMWERPKVSDADYSHYFRDWWKKDLESIILRDRNHPSIIMWSIGNEIPEANDTSGLRIAKWLSGEVRRLDPTRAVTEALVDMQGIMTGKSGWDAMAPHMALLDVPGYNYNFARYESDHVKYPERVMYASESMPPLSLENWTMAEKLPYVIGNFTWIAMDYLGEAGVGIPRLFDVPKDGKRPGQMEYIMEFFNPESWPAINDFQGDLDLIGNRKTPSFYQHVVWRTSKIEMLVHAPIPAGKMEIQSPWGFPDEIKSWNWKGNEGEKLQVHVYTRSKLVRLELNGKVVGEQNVDGEKSITATFMVPYEPGTLTARCYDDGKETASESIKTTGPPSSVRLIADRASIKADRNDLSYVMTEIADSEGNVVPDANDITVLYSIEGSGEIAAVGNGNPKDVSSFRQPLKKSYLGKCLAIVRPTGAPGKILLKATAEGLSGSSIEIITN